MTVFVNGDAGIQCSLCAVDIRLFDIYRGTGVPEGKKSMAFSLELRADDRTLTDADSEGVVTKVLAALKEKLGAILR